MVERQRRVLVTGGASGLGAATVTRFHADGELVAALDIDAERLHTDALPADIRIHADISEPNEATQGIDEAVEALGGLDVLVCCAGVSGGGTVADVTLKEWDRVFNVNVRGLFVCAQASLPHLQRTGGGVIVTIASQLGLVAAPDCAAYCASKAAVINLTRAMAIDHSADGIRVNCVCPGPTETPMLERRFERGINPDNERNNLRMKQAHNRFVTPAEIADAVAYLASPTAASTLGTVLVVDGGYTLR